MLTESSWYSGWAPSYSGVTLICTTCGALAPPAPSLTWMLTIWLATGLDTAFRYVRFSINNVISTPFRAETRSAS